jgi:hypothetical protein
VRMRGALLSAGLTPYLFADLCQELDTSSVPDGGVAPSATEYTCSACRATVSSERAERSEIVMTARSPRFQRDGAKCAGAANGAAGPRGTAGYPLRAGIKVSAEGMPHNALRSELPGSAIDCAHFLTPRSLLRVFDI